MNFSSVFTFLWVLTLFMVFSAGCMSSDNGPPYPLYGKSLDQICKGDSVNGSKWIVIEPISDKKVGEKITVTAKTNLSSGTWVSARTWPYTYNPVNRTDASGSSGISGGADTTVKEGNAGVNTIVFVADSKNFRPEPYIITFINDTEHVSACTWFNVSIAPEENPTISPSRSFNESGIIMNRNSTGFWIAIEPVTDTCLGDITSISGTTNLSVGENFSLAIRTTDFHGCQKTIYPCKYPDTVNAVCCSGGFNRTVTVIPGTGGTNIWLFSVNTSDFDFMPGLYGVYAKSGTAYTEQLFTILEQAKSSPAWIAVDPVSHYYLGDTITFQGRTNLPPGEFIETAVYSGEFIPCPKSTRNCQSNVTPCCGGYSAIVPVLAGTCGINTWSWDVSTSQHGFRADGEYIISASGRNGAVDNFSIFTVSGIPKSNVTLNLPANDPNGNALRFSGQANTGNGPEEILLLTVSSDSGKKVSSTVPVYRNGTGYSWNVSLKMSDIVPYNFLTVNVSSQTSPDIRIERTFLYNNEPAYYPYNSQSP